MNETIKTNYKEFLTANPAVAKIPYIETVPELTEKIPVYKTTTSNPQKELNNPPHNDATNPPPTAEVLRAVNIKVHNKTYERLIQSYQRGLTVKKFGRLRGNMDYLEDSWDVQIQPLTINYAYLKANELKLSEAKQMKLRDKYLKVRIRYDGTQYAIISAIKTQFTLSYA